MTETHREALSALVYGIHEKKLFVVVLGEVGVGKTTVLQSAMLAVADRQARIVQIAQPILSPGELTATIAQKLSAPPEEPVASADLECLDRLIGEEAKISGPVVIVIDEAQGLPEATLEHLRLLSNLSAGQNGQLQIIFVGQPEFWDMLQRPQLRHLRQRIAVRAIIKPLSNRDSKNYIDYKLRLAGGAAAEIMTQGAIKAALRAGRGIPRRLNIIMDNALATGFGLSIRPITAQIVREAAASIDGPVPGHKPRRAPVQGFKRPRLDSIVTATSHVLKQRRRIAFALGGIAGVLLIAAFIGNQTQRAPSGTPPAPQIATAPPIVAVDPAPRLPEPAITEPLHHYHDNVSSPAGFSADQLAILRSQEPLQKSQEPPGPPLSAPAARQSIAVSKPAAAEPAAPAAPLIAAAIPNPQKPADESHGIPLIRLPGITQIEYRTKPGETATTLLNQYYGRSDAAAISLFMMLNPLLTETGRISQGTWLHLPVSNAAQLNDPGQKAGLPENAAPPAASLPQSMPSSGADGTSGDAADAVQSDPS